VLSGLTGTLTGTIRSKSLASCPWKSGELSPVPGLGLCPGRTDPAGHLLAPTQLFDAIPPLPDVARGAYSLLAGQFLLPGEQGGQWPARGEALGLGTQLLFHRSAIADRSLIGLDATPLGTGEGRNED
jgi:hypothetical protein